MAKRNPRLPEGDDGRTIVNMNVEGMPWYIREPREEDKAGQTPMTDEEARMYTWAAIKSALLIVLVFALVFGLFIAFCDFVWFR